MLIVEYLISGLLFDTVAYRCKVYAGLTSTWKLIIILCIWKLCDKNTFFCARQLFRCGNSEGYMTQELFRFIWHGC